MGILHVSSLFRMRKAALICLLAIVALPAIATAQDEKPEPTEYSVERTEELRKLIGSLSGGSKVAVPGNKDDQGIFVIADGALIGNSAFGLLGSSVYSLVQLRVVNLTPEPFKLTTSTIRLKIKDTELIHQMLSKRGYLGTNRFRGGPPLISQTPAQVSIPSGQMKFVIASFKDLPSEMPYGKFRVTVNGLRKPVTMDLMAQAKRELGMTSRRIGPRGCLGVVKVDKRLGSLSSHHLVREIDALVAAGASRIALIFGDSAEKLLLRTNNWLLSQTRTDGSRRPPTHPDIPRTIAAFHVGPRPAVPARSQLGSGSDRNHATNEDTIAAALFDVYQQVSIADVVKDIETGTPEIRLAALRGGAGRLPDTMLRTLVRFANSQNDASLRLAAIESLSHFGNPEASKVLLAAVTDGDPKVAAVAVRALANSRFPAARESLMGLLGLNAGPSGENPKLDPKQRLQIANKLVEQPDAQWRDLYYEYASRADTFGLRALSAVLSVGHPKRTELLQGLLNAESSKVRSTALRALIDGGDPNENDIAMQYTLDYVGTKPPTNDMLNLLKKSTSAAIAPLLIQRFRDSPPTGTVRRSLLDVIASTGDQSTIPFFLEVLADPKAAAREKARPLRALQVLDPDKAVDQATRLITTRDLELTRAVYSILLDDASPDTVSSICDHLLGGIDNRKEDATAGTAIRTLGTIATPDARRCLRQLQNCKDKKRRDAADSTIRQMLSASPAILLLNEASQARADDKIEEAERHFEHGKKLDPDLPELYVQHGHLLTHSDRRELGVKEFEKALAIDPLHPIATSLRCIAIVVLGDVERGLKEVEYNSEKFNHDQIFNYNAACAYGQAIKRTKATAENVKQIAEWKEQGVKYLELCINELEFDDVKLFKEDPDLDPLRDMPRFRKLLKKLDPDAAKGDTPKKPQEDEN